MFSDHKSRRFIERRPSSLQVQVLCYEGAEFETEEETRLIDLSRSGARLRLAHKVELGQPILLSFAMPRLLRAYDQAEPVYNIWGIVRLVKRVTNEETGHSHTEIGVAFIGEYAPRGFLADPRKRYDLRPVPDENGLWQPREMSPRSGF